MALPFFYIASYNADQPELELDEDNSRHIIQVLRMKPGELLRLTDGRGQLLEAAIVDDHKKRCRVAVRSTATEPPHPANVTIAISPLKNASRFEWFLEKATEIGVTGIIPLLCERTERAATRQDRLQNILVSAMLQSQQAWLPVLAEPMPLPQLMRQSTGGQRYIAHCLEAPRATDSLAALSGDQPAASEPAPGSSAVNGAIPALILIGPEGDFSPKEVEAALEAGFVPVSLGRNRLRTETAGVVAATLLCIK